MQDKYHIEDILRRLIHQFTLNSPESALCASHLLRRESQVLTVCRRGSGLVHARP